MEQSSVAGGIVFYEQPRNVHVMIQSSAFLLPLMMDYSCYTLLWLHAQPSMFVNRAVPSALQMSPTRQGGCLRGVGESPQTGIKHETQHIPFHFLWYSVCNLLSGCGRWAAHPNTASSGNTALPSIRRPQPGGTPAQETGQTLLSWTPPPV